eukprot:COSAG02_NODE_61628_length_268_cov_0.609467_1_plen_89_part_11
MPVKAFCKLLGPSCAVVVDGAHAAGQLELDLPSLGCAAYTANLHKWFMTPKGTAFLWVAPGQHANVLPTVIGSEAPFFGAGGAVAQGKS